MTGLDVLRCDVDKGERPLTIAELLGRLARAGHRLRWLCQERSRSGQGWHILLGIRPAAASLSQLVALQAICGSDPYREANNLLRARQVEGKRVSRYWRQVSAVSVLYDPTY